MHRHEDVATANELLIDVKLGYRGPLRVLLDSCFASVQPLKAQHILRRVGTIARPGRHATNGTRQRAGSFPSRTCPQLLILEHIERCELVRVHTLHTQDLYARPREPTLWCLWSALHEQHNRRRSNGAIDGTADLIGETSGLEGCEEAGAWDGARGAGAGCGCGPEGLYLLVNGSYRNLGEDWRALYLGNCTS